MSNRSDEVKDLKEKCLLTNDIMDYWYVSQGKITVPSIDDREDMQFANEAFDVLGFTEVKVLSSGSLIEFSFRMKSTMSSRTLPV